MPEPTNLSDDDLYAIARRALPHWSLDADGLEIVSRSENTVFQLELADGRRFALRIHRPGYHTLAELESELLWTQALNEFGIGVPVGVRTLNGPGYAMVSTPDGQSSRAVGASIQSGSDERSIVGCFAQLGRIAAAMHNQAIAWQPPAEFTRHAFDVPGYVGEAPFWGRFWDIPILTASQRELLRSARAEIRATLTGYGKDRGTYSMIHADLHVHNVLVAGNERLHVIDFDDAGFGWHQYDFATALFGLEEQPYFEAISEALVDGYRAVRPFSDEALSLLPLFLLIRRLVLIGWQWDRPELGRRQGLEAYVEDACERVDAFRF